MDKLINGKPDKILGILTSLYITALLTNVSIGYRYISILNLNEAGGIFIFPLSFIVGDIISEVYDSNFAKTLIIFGVICQIIFSLYIFLIIRMPYPNFWHNYDAFFSIMNPYLRFTFASAGAVIVGSWINIHLLSKWNNLVQGKYFILRSLGSSFIGEFFVTIISMFIANFGKMNINELAYMMICCFVIKSIVSFVAVWPAAFVICLIKKNKTNNEINNAVKSKYFFKEIIKLLKNFSKPAFRVDKFDHENNMVSLYCRGARVVIKKRIHEVICNANLIHNMNPKQSSFLGYHYGLLIENVKNEVSYMLDKKNKTTFFLGLKKGSNKIISITRDGRINYKSKHSDEICTKHPLDLYRDDSTISYFEPSQACYIGILAGLSQKKAPYNPPTLILLNNTKKMNI